MPKYQFHWYWIGGAAAIVAAADDDNGDDDNDDEDDDDDQNYLYEIPYLQLIQIYQLRNLKLRILTCEIIAAETLRLPRGCAKSHLLRATRRNHLFQAW